MFFPTESRGIKDERNDNINKKLSTCKFYNT